MSIKNDYSRRTYSIRLFAPFRYLWWKHTARHSFEGPFVCGSEYPLPAKLGLCILTWYAFLQASLTMGARGETSLSILRSVVLCRVLPE